MAKMPETITLEIVFDEEDFEILHNEYKQRAKDLKERMMTLENSYVELSELYEKEHEKAMLWEYNKDYIRKLGDLVQDNEDYFDALPGDIKLERVFHRLEKNLNLEVRFKNDR